MADEWCQRYPAYTVEAFDNLPWAAMMEQRAVWVGEDIAQQVLRARAGAKGG